MSKPKPPAQCLAIIICEDVVEDARTHNKCILNTYNAIHSLQYPATHPKLTVFLSLTNGRGEMPLEVRLGRDGQEPLMKLGGSVRFPDPLAVTDIILRLRNVPFPEEGTYVVQVMVGETLLCHRKVTAVVAAPGKGAGQ